jgi:hypothetical protein
MEPVQSPSLMHGMPQVARHDAQFCTQAKPQSQFPGDVHVWSNVVQRPLLLPPEPLTELTGVKAHPLASKQVDSVAPVHDPRGVPTQAAFQKHPAIPLHD